MTRKENCGGRRSRLWAAAAGLSVLVAQAGCGLDEVQIPEIDGPSGQAFQIRMTARPDNLVADGRDSSVIVATLFGPNGQRVANRDIFFAVADERGVFADIGVLIGSNGPGTGATIRTNGRGEAAIVYEAPPRNDATANQTVMVRARLVGDDVNGQLYNFVRIELRSAEPRLFPPNPNNLLPDCTFIVEAPTGLRRNEVILFQSTSDDSDGEIVRYEWLFGDGSGSDRPDTAHVYRLAGSYTVTHIVTDDDGGQDACAAALTISQ